MDNPQFTAVSVDISGSGSSTLVDFYKTCHTYTPQCLWLFWGISEFFDKFSFGGHSWNCQVLTQFYINKFFEQYLSKCETRPVNVILRQSAVQDSQHRPTLAGVGSESNISRSSSTSVVNAIWTWRLLRSMIWITVSVRRLKTSSLISFEMEKSNQRERLDDLVVRAFPQSFKGKS